MDHLFLIQLISSFLIGGIFIAFLSLISEKASEMIAGIIISLPSTVVIGYFFIGWALSPNAIKEIAPAAPATIGVTMIFTVTYLYLSKINIKKIPSIVLCASGSLAVWFVLAIPIAIYEFSNLLISLIIYLVCIVFAYIFLTILPKEKSNHVIVKYSASQKIGRAIFAGIVISLAVFLSKVLTPFWGGIFSLFPAAFLSTLIILHYHYDSKFLFKIWKNSPLGTIIFTIYPLTAIYTFPTFGIWIGTILSYGMSLFSFLLLRRVFK